MHANIFDGEGADRKYKAPFSAVLQVTPCPFDRAHKAGVVFSNDGIEDGPFRTMAVVRPGSVLKDARKRLVQHEAAQQANSPQMGLFDIQLPDVVEDEPTGSDPVNDKLAGL